MTKILVVFTGGTIGSVTKKGIINTSKQTSFELIELFKQQTRQQVEFDCIQPLQILSENLFPTAWETLIQAIETQSLKEYAGIIVTHGTDTLAFTAAALGLYFNQLTIPLLLVSSNYPLEHPKANGVANFNCAVEFICQRKQQGVFVAYQNQGQTMQVHLATRLASSLQLSSDFISIQSKAYLEFENHQFKQLTPLKNETYPTKLKADFSKRILLVKPYPGLNYSQINLENVDAVLHDLYHSGTACMIDDWGENHNLLSFISQCDKQNIKVYLAPALKTKDSYNSTYELLKRGAQMIWNTSLEVSYVKLLLGYSNFNDLNKISAFLNSNILHEHLDVI